MKWSLVKTVISKWAIPVAFSICIFLIGFSGWVGYTVGKELQILDRSP